MDLNYGTYIFEKNGKETKYELKTKNEVARDIAEKIIELLGWNRYFSHLPL